MSYVGIYASLGSALGWAICISCFTIASLKLGEKTGVHIMNFYRTIIATIGTSFVFFIPGIDHGLTHITTSQFFLIFLGGMASLVIADTFLYTACVKIGAGYSALLFGTYPIMIVMFAWPLYGETLGWIAFAGIFLTFLGVAGVNLQREKLKRDKDTNFPINKNTKIGIVFAILAALSQAAAFMILKPTMMGPYAIDPLMINFIRFAIAAAAFAVFNLYLGTFKELRWSDNLKKALPWIAIGAVIGNVIGSWLSLIPFTESFKIPAGMASALMSTTPIMILPLVIFGPKLIREPVNWKIFWYVCLSVIGVSIILNHS